MLRFRGFSLCYYLLPIGNEPRCLDLSNCVLGNMEYVGRATQLGHVSQVTTVPPFHLTGNFYPKWADLKEKRCLALQDNFTTCFREYIMKELGYYEGF